MKFVQLGHEQETRFADFLKQLKENGDEAFFSPHDFTDSEASRLARYQGMDYYCLMIANERILGYGFLRWHKGYSRPSLGIAIHPNERKKGLAELLMQHLHEEARRLGAKQVRLRVRKENEPAIRLYKEFGYDLKPDEEEGLLVGFATL